LQAFQNATFHTFDTMSTDVQCPFATAEVLVLVPLIPSIGFHSMCYPSLTTTSRWCQPWRRNGNGGGGNNRLYCIHKHLETFGVHSALSGRKVERASERESASPFKRSDNCSLQRAFRRYSSRWHAWPNVIKN